MNRKALSFLLFTAIFGLSMILVGCKGTSTIDFYRESQVFSPLSTGYQKPSKTVKNSSGYVIYKDETYNNESLGKKFGPKDLNFDLPRK